MIKQLYKLIYIGGKLFKKITILADKYLGKSNLLLNILLDKIGLMTTKRAKIIFSKLILTEINEKIKEKLEVYYKELNDLK